MAKAKIDSTINVTATAKYSDIEKLNAKLKQTQTTLKRFQLGVVAAVPALMKLANSAIEAGKASLQLGAGLKDLADKSGMGTEQMQVLGRVAAQNGSSIEEMSKGVLKLTKSTQDAAQGNKGLSERFARLGIDIQTFKALSPEKQMERLGVAVATAKDKQSMMADVMALIGQEAGPKLLQSLNKLGTEGYDTLAKNAKQSGEILSDSSIESLAKADQALKDFGYRWKIITAEAVAWATDLYDKVNNYGTQQAAQEAIMANGLDNAKTSALLRTLASEQIAKGDLHAAQMTLDAASEWLDAAAKRGEARRRFEQFDGTAGGMLGADPLDKQLAWQKQLGEELLKAKQVQAEREKALAEAAAEAQRVALEAQIADILALDEAARQKRREANLKEAQDEQTLRDQINKEAAQKTAQQIAAHQAQIASAQAALAAALPQSEQVRAQAAEFYAQLQFLQDNAKLSQDEINRATEHYIGLLDKARELAADETLTAVWEQSTQSARALVEVFEGLDATIENQLGNTLKEFVETGTADMKKLGQSILNEVIQAMLKALVLKPLLTGLGGMFGGAAGGFFSGLGGAMGLPGMPGKASGGPVTGRRPYIVGERGPELFVPPRSGTIIDANKTAAALAGDTATGGDRGPQTIYQIDARGADVGAVQRLEHALMRLAGPGVVEKRARAAEADRARRG